MIIRGLTREQLSRCADAAHVRLYNLCKHGTGYALTLRPVDRDKWRKVSFHAGRRRVWAVCFHGHMDFMLNVYALNAEAVIISTMARYEGLEEFARTYEGTGSRNVGSIMHPVFMDEACECDREETEPLRSRLAELQQVRRGAALCLRQ